MTRRTASQKPAIAALEDAFKALADGTRLRILALLGDNEVCVCHIHATLDLPQPTVSRHLAYLRRAGLVQTRREGVWMHYRLARSPHREIQRVLDAAIAAVRELPTPADDRKHFERTFGKLYVLDSPDGGACCAPRG